MSAPAHETGIRLYDTALGRVEPLLTAEPRKLRMYVCGPTTYAPSHLGHARSYVAYDVLKRALRARGVATLHVQNFTDMEEAIARRAAEEGMNPFDLAEKYARAYLEDMASLRVLPATEYPYASRNVDRMIAIVERLVEMGAAYAVDCREAHGEPPGEGPRAVCDIYFDAAKAPRFGHLIGRSLEEISADAPQRGDRRNVADFALWKAHDDWGVTWKSPWGDGRPGWHVECVAMATGVLGPSFDLHGGGLDLVFPHHESEAAIAETVNGKPYAARWMHNGFVTVGRAKMSKSVGNYLTIRDALAAHPAEAVRAWLVSTHYRAPLEYDAARLKVRENAARRAAEVGRRVAVAAGTATPGRVPAALAAAVRAFDAALADDLRTDVALEEADNAIEICDAILPEATPDVAAAMLDVLVSMGDQLGIFWAITDRAPR